MESRTQGRLGSGRGTVECVSIWKKKRKTQSHTIQCVTVTAIHSTGQGWECCRRRGEEREEASFNIKNHHGVSDQWRYTGVIILDLYTEELNIRYQLNWTLWDGFLSRGFFFWGEKIKNKAGLGPLYLLDFNRS